MANGAPSVILNKRLSDANIHILMHNLTFKWISITISHPTHEVFFFFKSLKDFVIH